jgi:hypothetical protein
MRFSKLVLGSAKSRIYAEKRTKRGFSKNVHMGIDFFFVLTSYGIWIPGTLN